MCILADGVHACPEGWSANPPALVYEDGVDGRSCGPCTCQLGPVTCEAQAKFIVYDDDANGDGVLDNGAPCSGAALQGAGCINVTDAFTSAHRAVKPPMVNPIATKTCTGGADLGQIEPSGAHTLCCP